MEEKGVSSIIAIAIVIIVVVAGFGIWYLLPRPQLITKSLYQMVPTPADLPGWTMRENYYLTASQLPGILDQMPGILENIYKNFLGWGFESSHWLIYEKGNNSLGFYVSRFSSIGGAEKAFDWSASDLESEAIWSRDKTTCQVSVGNESLGLFENKMIIVPTLESFLDVIYFRKANILANALISGDNISKGGSLPYALLLENKIG